MSFRRCLDSATAVCCAEQRIFFVRQPIKNITSECHKDKMIFKRPMKAYLTCPQRL
jgi:hypothetical protein